MAKYVESIINEFFDGTDYLRPALLSVLLIWFMILILKSLKKHPKRYKVIIILSVIGIMALLFNIFAW